MHAALKLVYRYRQLAGKCQAAAGLAFDEIHELAALEAFFAGDDRPDTGAGESPAPPASAGYREPRAGARGFSRESVHAEATLRAGKGSTPIEVVDLGPGGLKARCDLALVPGETVELALAPTSAGLLSYRFRAVVAWCVAAGDVRCAGFAFVGTPIELRHQAKTRGAPRTPALPHQRGRSAPAPRAPRERSPAPAPSAAAT